MRGIAAWNRLDGDRHLWVTAEATSDGGFCRNPDEIETGVRALRDAGYAIVSIGFFVTQTRKSENGN